MCPSKCIISSNGIIWHCYVLRNQLQELYMYMNMLSSTIDSYSNSIYVFSLPEKPLAGQRSRICLSN